jgi:integrase
MPKIKGTPTVRFILQSTKEPKVKTYVFLYFVYKGKRLKYSTGIKVRPDQWANARANAKCPERADVNEDLAKMERYTVEIYRATAGKIDPIEFRLELDYRMGYKDRPEDIKIEVPTLLQFVEQVLQERMSQPNVKVNSVSAISRIQKHLVAYSDEKKKTFTFNDITKVFFNDFRGWLFTEPRSLQNNYVHKLFTLLKMFMADAKERGYHSNEAFKGFSMPIVKTENIYLSFDELERLYKIDFSDNKRLERVRDLFLIGCYTSLRHSDFSNLRPEHIITESGQRMIKITTKKVGKMVQIPLLPIADTLLQKYNNTAPSIKSQKMNDYLKEIGEIAGFNETIILPETAGGIMKEVEYKKWELFSTKIARRSFATNFIAMGIPTDVIRIILGHSTDRQTLQYVGMDNVTNALNFANLIQQNERFKV